MNDYSSLFTSGLMLLCDSANTRSRHSSAEMSPADDSKNNAPGLRSFLSLEMAESLRTFATGSPSNPPSRAHSRKPSSERRSRPAPVASSSKHVIKAPASPASSRRRSLPQPKPAPLSELPVVPTAQTHSRSRSDSAASQAFPVTVISAPKSDSASFTLPEPTAYGKSTSRKEHLAPSSLKLELSSAPTTPCSPFPTTPRSSHVISMFSPLTPPTADSPWFPTIDVASDTWSDPFAGALSPTTTESALRLHFPGGLPVIESENIAPLNQRPAIAKRARRRTRHSAPSRNTSLAAHSMRSSQGSVSTTYKKSQRSGALAQLEGRAAIQRSEWMSDDEEAASSKLRGLSLMPSMNFKSESDPLVLSINRSFIDLTDDAASLAALQRPTALA